MTRTEVGKFSNKMDTSGWLIHSSMSVRLFLEGIELMAHSLWQEGVKLEVHVTRVLNVNRSMSDRSWCEYAQSERSYFPFAMPLQNEE